MELTPTDLVPRMLTRLKLTAIRDQLDSLLDEVSRQDLTLRESLALLCEREIARKDERRIEMGTSIAKFPFVRELSGFDFAAQPSRLAERGPRPVWIEGTVAPYRAAHGRIRDTAVVRDVSEFRERTQALAESAQEERKEPILTRLRRSGRSRGGGASLCSRRAARHAALARIRGLWRTLVPSGERWCRAGSGRSPSPRLGRSRRRRSGALRPRDQRPRRHAARGRISIATRPVEIKETSLADLLQLPPGAYVRISVSDTGSGIARDIRERIFEPFFATKRVGGGSGLGLAMVQAIFVRERRPGRGGGRWRKRHPVRRLPAGGARMSPASSRRTAISAERGPRGRGDDS